MEQSEENEEETFAARKTLSGNNGSSDFSTAYLRMMTVHPSTHVDHADSESKW